MLYGQEGHSFKPWHSCKKLLRSSISLKWLRKTNKQNIFFFLMHHNHMGTCIAGAVREQKLHHCPWHIMWWPYRLCCHNNKKNSINNNGYPTQSFPAHWVAVWWPGVNGGYKNPAPRYISFNFIGTDWYLRLGLGYNFQLTISSWHTTQCMNILSTLQ